VNKFVLTLAALVSLSAAAAAQESRQTLRLEEPAWPFVESSAPANDRSTDLPLSLAETAPDRDDKPGDHNDHPFSIGAVVGYLNAKDADSGTWTAGVQARLRMGHFAAEASIMFHENDFENGDVVIVQYPVQLTAFLYILDKGPIQPYVLGGVGWYYTRIEYRDTLSAIPDKTDNTFGWHFGAGVELFLSDRVSLNGDVRYIFIDPDTDKVVDQDFNYWQITFGINFLF
jgi:opacity protein-like surface antigen